MSNNFTQTVAVIVSHVNSARTIGNCLRHLIRQDYPKNLIQIVVVDAGSVDGSIEIVKKTECEIIRQIVKPGCTEPEGQSLGIQSCKSDIIMFTNSDIYVPPNWIRKHLEWLNRGYDLVGGKVFWGGDKYAFTWNMPAPNDPQHVQQQGLGLGFSNCSIRKSYLESVGGLKNLTSQHDTELAFRVIRSGGKMVLDPEIEVYHDHPFRSVRGSYLRSSGYALNHVIVMRAAYGRLVSGSGSPAMISLGTFIKEWLALNAIRTYRQNYKEAYQKKIQIGLLEFLAIRLISTKLGQIIGIARGVIKRNVTYSSIPDMHNITEKVTKRKVTELAPLR
jgi:glycosyltransferase involved in cell wall biosynthesis